MIESSHAPARRPTRILRGVGCALLGLGAVWSLGGATVHRGPQAAPPAPQEVRRLYEVGQTSIPPEIDGRLDDPVWISAPLSEPFVDIRGDGHPEPEWETRVRMLWDDSALYIGASLEEPHLWATLTERDAIIYHDHDFEVFLDPDGDGVAYYEFEINAFGTVFDLFLDRPYSEGGSATIEWDMNETTSAVALDGTLNDAADVDAGWSVEIRIPWSDLVPPDGMPDPNPTFTEGVSPSPGDLWRVNFSRVQWPLLRTEAGGYERAAEPSFEVHHEDNWVWSPQGVINMHIPDRWGFVRFLPEENR